jgi:hypothetical protein
MATTNSTPVPASDRELNLLHLMQRVWTYSITTKSDDARAYADEIAEGASRGFLTTLIVYGTPSPLYGRLWKLTPEGLLFLSLNSHHIANEETAAYAQDHSVD